MSDHSQTLVFDTVQEADAQRVVDLALDYMISAGFIKAGLEDCALCQDGRGYRPGSNWAQIVVNRPIWAYRQLSDREMPPDPPPRPNLRPYDIAHFLEFAVNGVRPYAGRRQIFASGENESEFRGGNCPACAVEVDPQWEILEVFDAWYKGDAVTVRCPLCGAASPLQDWDFHPFFAFGTSALEFWNWPRLSDQFKNDLVRVVGVPRMRIVVAHI